MKKGDKLIPKGSLKDNARRIFVQAELKEESKELHNPGCGWYHMYTFSLFPEKSENQQPLYLDPQSREEQLVLLLMDLGKFRDCRLSEAALCRTEEILDFFQEQGKDLILRFTYDTQGKGLEKEPCSLSLIKGHMKQLGSVITRYAGSILTLQGLLVGNWGEMHNSRFLSQQNLTDLAETMYQATEGSCYLAVRTPKQWRNIISCSSIPSGLREKLGLFNDGMFGSSTDLGTYQNGCREEEMSWQEAYMRHRPNGGEALKGEGLTGYKTAAWEMRQMHTIYLNSVHQQEQLQHWKEELVCESGCWRGISGYEYIGRHLGYRFVVRRAKLIQGLDKKKRLQITVENCGFAELCQRADCFLMIEHQDGSLESRLIPTDACQWESGEKAVVEAELPEWTPHEGMRLFLKLQRKRDRRNICFGNRLADSLTADGAALLGEYR